MTLVAQTFDQLINFTRTSAGTFVGSNGLIQNTPASVNLLTFTQEFDNAAWAKNAVTISANAAVAPDATSTADKLVENSSTSVHNAAQTVTTTISTAYTISVYAKAAERTWLALDPVNPGITNNVTYFDLANGVVGTNAAGNTASIVSVGDGWYRCIVTRTTTGTQTSLRMEVGIASANNTANYTGNGTSGILVWGAQVEVGSTATTYTRNFGGRFPPRFDYDPATLLPRGLLVEEQRTNLLLRSEDFTNVDWVKSGAGTGTAPVVTANAATAPDGTTTADLVDLVNTGTTASDWSWIYQNYIPSAGVAYTFSVWVKAATAGDVGKIVRLTGLPVVPAVTLTSDWVRVSVTATTVGTSTISVGVRIRGTETTDTSVSLYMWGAQLELGAFATSYIPTVASQVTRTADVVTIAAPNFAPWYNATEGTLYAAFDTYGAAAGANVKSVASLDDTTSNNRIYMYVWTGGLVTEAVTTGGVSQAQPSSSPAVGSNVTIQSAMVYKVNDFAVVTDGGAPGTDTSGTIPTVSQLGLGVHLGGTQLNGHLRSIRYYPVRLTNATLQALTA